MGGTSKRVEEQQLLTGALAQPQAAQVLAELVEQRIINIHTTANREEYGIAHEALLEGWQRLKTWLNEDREFLFWCQRLDTALAGWQEANADAGALLRGAPLVEAIRWHRERTDDISPRGLEFIAASLRRQSRLRWLARGAVTSLLVLTTIASAAAYVATLSRRQAELNLQVATAAVDEMLTRVGSDTLKDIPQLETIRRDLLTEARALYASLADQNSRNADLRLQAALAPARIADIDRQLGDMAAATLGLQTAITQLEILETADAGEAASITSELATLHNRLGRVLEALAQTAEDAQMAEDHFTESIAMLQSLLEVAPDNARLQLDQALAYLNRAILYKNKLQDAERAGQDLLAAIALVAERDMPSAALHLEKVQLLARSNNTLANVLLEQKSPEEALVRYQLAAGYFAALHDENPVDRDYQLELAKTYNNIATLHISGGAVNEDAVGTALTYSQQAIELFDALARPLPEIRLELANAYNVGGRILLLSEHYGQAEELFSQGERLLTTLLQESPDNDNYKFRYAVMLTNLAFSQIQGSQFASVPDTKSRLSLIMAQLPQDNRGLLENQDLYQAVQTWH
jgi:hypothetical protein